MLGFWKWILVALSIASVAAAHSSPPPPTTEACNLELIRALASRHFQEHQIKEVRADRGIITLVLRSRDGMRGFAIALHASGTELSTAAMGVGIDEAELTLVTAPVTRWWQDAELQRRLASCCTAVRDTGAGELAARLRTALQAVPAADDRSASPAPLLGAWSHLRSWMSQPNLPPLLALVVGSAWIALALTLGRAVFLMTDSLPCRLSFLGLFLYSMVLSWTLSSGGPGDLRLNLAGIWGIRELDLRWGSAPIALFRLLALALGGLHDIHIVWTNRVLASLLPILMCGIVVELQVNAAAALVAAFIVASHPLLIAFSGDLGRQPTYLFAALGSIWGLVGFLRQGRAHLFVAFVLGTILATASRPEGAHVLVVGLAALILVPAAPRRRVVVGVALIFLATLAFVYLRHAIEYGTELKSRSLEIIGSPTALLWTILFDPDFTPLAWIMMWALGVVVGLRRRAAWVAIVAVLGLHIVWTSTALYDTFVGYDRQVASARYESILLLPFVIGTALCVETWLAAQTWIKATGVAVFLAGTAITFPRTYETLLAPFTVDYEYHFLRQQALALPGGSRLYILESKVNDIGFVDAALVGKFVDSETEFAVWDPTVCDGAASPPSNTYLYVGSSCAEVIDQPRRDLGPRYPRWLQECASVRARLIGGEVAEIDVPAHKMSWYDFKESTVRLSVYRDPCSPPPPAHPSSSGPPLGLVRNDGDA